MEHPSELRIRRQTVRLRRVRWFDRSAESTRARIRTRRVAQQQGGWLFRAPSPGYGGREGGGASAWWRWGRLDQRGRRSKARVGLCDLRHNSPTGYGYHGTKVVGPRPTGDRRSEVPWCDEGHVSGGSCCCEDQGTAWCKGTRDLKPTAEQLVAFGYGRPGRLSVFKGLSVFRDTRT